MGIHPTFCENQDRVTNRALAVRYCSPRVALGRVQIACFIPAPDRTPADLLALWITEATTVVLTRTKMELMHQAAVPDCHALAERAVLIVEPDPLASIKLRVGLHQWKLLNPIRRVATFSGLMSYFQSRGVYSDGDLYPYPAAVLLSINLPNFESTRAQAWIRSSLLHRKMPIIVLGDVKHEPLLEAAVKFGANAYMTRPFDPREFHCICRLLRLPVVFGANHVELGV